MLGTLCVIDDRPRQLTTSQIESLKAIKRQLQDQLRLRVALHTSEQARRKIQQEQSKFDAASHLLDRLTERLPEVFWLMASDGSNALYASPSFGDVWGITREQFYQDPLCWMSRVHPEDLPQLKAKLSDAPVREQAEDSFTYRIIDEDGEICRWARTTAFVVEAESGPNNVAGLTSDITDQVHENRRLEDRADHFETRLDETLKQLWHIQKMESLGRMAGSISHDFNNLLSIILSCTTYMLHNTDADNTHRDELLDIQSAAKRSATLTKQLLAFSRKQKLEAQVTGLDDVLEEMRNLFLRVLSVQVDLKIQPEAGDLEVFVDPGQLEQVLMNLVVNAGDALQGDQATDSPQIVVRTSREVVSEDQAATLPVGTYGVISVQDNGTGIAPDVIDTIFEPFFTTKEPGNGTGLGLATVHGIVTQSGGYIDVDSDLGEGTRFTIWLPEATDQQ
jgi:PAS domain S-box-containing protein